jgi:hypothetical protein
MLALIPVEVARPQLKPLGISRRPSSQAGGRDGIALVTFVPFIRLILAAFCYPDMQFVIRAIVV